MVTVLTGPLLDRGDRPGVPTQLNSQVVAADPKTGQMTSLVAISNKCWIGLSSERTCMFLTCYGLMCLGLLILSY